MPFTLSHPSAALAAWPLVRRGHLPLAPFVVGAMAPDFEYLLRLEPYALVSHSARGILTFDLPAGVVALIAWYLLLAPFARALFALSPPPLHRRWGVGEVAGALVALALGSVSHVVWDAFTHRDAWGPVVVPGLRATAFTIAGAPVAWYNALQVASSLVGGGVVAAWLGREVQSEGGGWRALIVPWRMRRWLALGVAVVAMAAWNAPRRGMMSDPSRTKIVFGRAAVGGLVGLAAGMATLALQYRVQRKSGTRNPSGGRHA